MNLKTTLETLRRIERLLDGWQSSDNIPALERDLACDLLRRAYDDILFSDNNMAAAPEVPPTEQPPAARVDDETVGEAADTPADAAVDADAAPAVHAASPADRVEPALPEDPAETPEELPENIGTSVESPAAENALVEERDEVLAESPAERTEPSAEEPAAEGASAVKPAEKVSPAEESAENNALVEDPAEANLPVAPYAEESAEDDAPVEAPAEQSTEENIPVETSAVETPAVASVEETVPVEVLAEGLVEEDASVEKSVGEPVAENVSIGMPAEEPAAEDAPVEVPVGELAEEEIPVEEFGEADEAAEEPDDAVSSAQMAATPVPEPFADLVIDPVFEVFTDEDAEEMDGAEDTEAVPPMDSVGAMDVAGAVNVVEAVEAVGAADDTEIVEETETEETEIAEETDAAETSDVVEEAGVMEEAEHEQPAAAPAVRPSVEATVAPVVDPVADLVADPFAESDRDPVPAPAETSVGESPADAAASNVETLEEMAARFKNASGRRRKSRRAFMSLYDDDETARRGDRNDQLELSDWGIEPSDPSSKLRHARELFGLPVDDPDTTTPGQTAQPVADAAATDDEYEIEVVDFLDDDDPMPNDRNAKPAVESPVTPVTRPTLEPAPQPTRPMPSPRPSVEPVREVREEREVRSDADDDLPFDEAVVALEDPDDAPSAAPTFGRNESPEHSESSDAGAVSFEAIEIVEIADEEAAEIAEDNAQHADNKTIVGKPTLPRTAAPAPSATQPAAVQGLYGREPKSPASTTVLGEVMGHDGPTVGDTLGRRPDVADVAARADVPDDLNRAISVGDRFVLLRDLFDGDQALCDRTLKRLSTFDDLDDCMIWITENFAWNANSEGAKLIMGVLERKLG